MVWKRFCKNFHDGSGNKMSVVGKRNLKTEVARGGIISVESARNCASFVDRIV